MVLTHNQLCVLLTTKGPARVVVCGQPFMFKGINRATQSGETFTMTIQDYDYPNEEFNVLVQLKK